MDDASRQLAREIQWLRGEMPGSMLAFRKDERSRLTSVAQKVEGVLRRPKLRKLLALLGKRNNSLEKGNRPFLLSPYLLHAVSSVDARLAALSKLPALSRRASEVRQHFRDASTRSKALAVLLRKAPQPGVALAARNYLSDAHALFAALPTLTAESEADTIEPLDRVLERAAEVLDFIARTIPRGGQQVETTSQQLQLRSRVAGLFGVFRKQLGHPYHSHVATLATLLSNIPTSTDYVKKMDRRMLRRPAGDKAR
jgi:hypothetical protein